MYRKLIKQLMDFILALCAIIIISPVLLIVAILVKVKLGSPVIFKQRRPGLYEKIFTIYKFRTMTNERDENGELLPDDVRLTDFGKFLRSTSLDELPELFNVLKKDMSIVGPRPLLERYIPYYTEEEHHRHDVLPGLTGLAQVSGRNFLSWDDRLYFDLLYVKNVNICLDIIIVFKTFVSILKKKDISDRSNIFQKDDGNLYILIAGFEHPYSQPLDIERSKVEESLY